VAPQGHKYCGIAIKRIACIDLGASGEQVSDDLDVVRARSIDESVDTDTETVEAVNIRAALEENLDGFKVADQTGHGEWSTIGSLHAVGRIARVKESLQRLVVVGDNRCVDAPLRIGPELLNRMGKRANRGVGLVLSAASEYD
jgi:hypothetical protein